MEVLEVVKGQIRESPSGHRRSPRHTLRLLSLYIMYLHYFWGSFL